MRINLAKSAGFCFGVKRALDIALQTSLKGKPVYMLGDIVHNEDVVKRIEASGIKKIKRLIQGKNRILLIRAHGAAIRIIREAKQLGYTIVDATCPMVKEIHRIAVRMADKGYQIIIIGDKRHAEVQGIAGQLQRKAVIIDDVRNIPLKEIQKIKKACIVVQSTQNIEKVLEIVEILKSHIRDSEFFNTICRPTYIKQQEIKTLPLSNDVMIIIGSKKSANTKRLFEISKSMNKRSYWINSKEEIKTDWFNGARNVGVTAGASTPENTIREIVDYIKGIGNCR